jgi:hypothetical protein
MRSTALVLAMFALAATPAAGDVIVLNDGTQLVGDIERQTVAGEEGYVITHADGTQSFAPSTRIARIVLGRDELPDDPEVRNRDVSRLEALRRGFERTDDLDLIVRRIEVFIDRLDPDSEALGPARQELATWQDRRNGVTVPLGDEWVTPAERDRRLAAAFGRINEARLHFKSGDAATGVARATELLSRPESAAAGYYLLGVHAMEEAPLAEARQHFEAVRSLLPDHAPTLTNLAAVEARVERYDRSAWLLAEALADPPALPEAVDAAAELLRLVDDPDDRNVLRLGDRFGPAESLRRAEMAEQGLFRWGTTWVDAAERDRLQALQAEVEATVAELKTEFDTLGREVARIEDRIRGNLRYMDRLRAASLVRDAEGNVRRLPLPDDYYDAERENEALGVQRAEMLTARVDLDRRAAAERAKLPSPPFAGTLPTVGVDGVPVLLPPASSPATRPADEDGP